MRWTPLSLYRALLIVSIVSLACAVGYFGYQADQIYDATAINYCGNEPPKFLVAPNAQTILVTYGVDCGPATQHMTRASIISNGAEFLGDRTPAFIVVGKQFDFRPRWLDGEHLELAVPIQSEIYHQETNAGGVTISYRR